MSIERKILVVDDDNGIRLMIQRLLEMKGYLVVTASNGSECIQQVQDHKPDLILLDIGMPQVGGISALNLLKHNESMRHIPVILVSGEVSPEKAQIAAKLGGDDFVQKPFKSEELLGRIQKHLLRMDFPGLKNLLLTLKGRDNGLSILATHAAGRALDVHIGNFRGIDVRVIVPRGFEAKDVRALDETGAMTNIVVLANLDFSWKCLWPASTPAATDGTVRPLAKAG